MPVSSLIRDYFTWVKTRSKFQQLYSINYKMFTSTVPELKNEQINHISFHVLKWGISTCK